MKTYRILSITLLLLFFQNGMAQNEGSKKLQLPYVFTDHMVIQRDKPIKIWGKSKALASIKVSFFGSKKKTKADQYGLWKVEFPAMHHGGPGEIRIQSNKEVIRISDVLIGEVWLCAGQSNMYWPLKSSENGELEILKSEYPNIRLLDMQGPAWPGAGNFSSEQIQKHFPDQYFSGSWTPCKPKTAANFSAVAYHFGKELYDSLKVPIGLIDLAVGGAPTESFIAKSELKQHEDLNRLLDDWFNNDRIHPWVRSRAKDNLSLWDENSNGQMPKHPFEPSMLFEAGIQPILPLSLRGFLWYQGESNLPTPTDSYPVDPEQNKQLLHLLINSWRTAFKQGDLPFYYVQLPNINRDWAAYRDMQRKTLDEIKNTGMAVTIDIGNPHDVHPRNKKDVGYRLALVALAETYGYDISDYASPRPKNAILNDHELVVEFVHADHGLVQQASGFSGFQLAGANGRYRPATTKVDGKHILVSHPEIKNPMAVRYAWAPNPVLSIYNSRALPASPFEIVLQNQSPDDPSYVDVFTAGKDPIQGIFNAPGRFAQYREQNVVITNNGTVVVVCQAREKSNWSDRSGQDLVVKTSSDNGLSWSHTSLIAVHNNHSIVPNAAMYDQVKNRIHVLYNVTEWDYDNPPVRIKGEMHDDVCRQYVITSDDAGKTWSAPRDISDMIDTDGAVAVFGSGEGIQLKHPAHKNRLIVAGGDFNLGKQILCYYSDDLGDTWKRGQAVPVPEGAAMASETKIVELPDGRLILNSRTFIPDDKNQRLRSQAYSSDGGITWTSLENVEDLKTVSCNAALLGVNHPKGKDGMILLNSLPFGPGRTHGCIYVSFDHGRSWPYKKVLIEEQFAYSSLVQFEDGYLGLFYEARGHKDIKLVRFSLDWLLEE